MRHGSAVAVVLVIGLLKTGALAEDWTEFRGPTGQGHSTTTGLPTHWTKSEHVAWMHELPGKGWSSPVLLGKRLYLTAAVPTGDGEAGPQSLRAILGSAGSGGLISERESFHQTAPRPITVQKHKSITT